MNRTWNSTRIAAFLAASCGVGLVATAGGGGSPDGADPSCMENNTLPACNYYTDTTPECPDTLLGGGQCGVKPAETLGLTGAAPATVDCIVIVKVQASDGTCISAGTFEVGVSCSRASGDPCSGGGSH